MGKCIICNTEVKEESEYCDHCKALFLEPQDTDEILPEKPLSMDKKDFGMQEGLESYIPKNYSIFDTNVDVITGNKEFDSLLNPSSSEDQMFSLKEDAFHESENEVLNEIDSIEEAVIDNREEQELEDKNLDHKMIQDDEIAELLGSIAIEETAVTQEQTFKENDLNEAEDDLIEVEKDKGIINSENDTTDFSTSWNKNDEIEGEFAVGSTPEFEGNQDILDLLNEINKTPEEINHADYTSDVLSIDDFMVNEETSEDPILSLYETQDSVTNSLSKDIGGIYQDALGGITNLEDVGIDEELLKLIPDVTTLADGQNDEVDDLQMQGLPKKTAKKKSKNGTKKSLFAKLFGNVKEDITEEEKEQRKQQIIEDANRKEKEQKEEEQAKKSAVAKKKADKIAAKKKTQDEAAKAKQAKADKAKAKKEEKERLSREIQELIDEIDENEGRINRIGASFVFALFASIALFVVIGTNIYSYAINIQNATNSFNMQRYNEAYNEVYGLDIKDEDIEIYDKIMTVMFVNKQLNSYNNYSAIGMYPEALDSLLKGLERYDKYYTLATKLGIQTDLDYVRNQIVNELDNVFLLSVEDAYDIINQPDQTQYSIAVYNKVYENLDEKLIQTTEK